MERKIRIAVSIAAFIGLLVPQNESWRIGILWYLKLETVFTVVQIFLGMASLIYTFVVKQYMFLLSEAIYLFALLWWILALPLLLLWNLLLLKPRKNKLKIAYRTWLLISLFSNVFVSYTSALTPSQGWLHITNLVFLFIAIGAEIWLWITEKRMKVSE